MIADAVPRLRGGNLGGRLVLEKWMKPSLFRATSATGVLWKYEAVARVRAVRRLVLLELSDGSHTDMVLPRKRRARPVACAISVRRDGAVAIE